MQEYSTKDNIEKLLEESSKEITLSLKNKNFREINSTLNSFIEAYLNSGIKDDSLVIQLRQFTFQLICREFQLAEQNVEIEMQRLSSEFLSQEFPTQDTSWFYASIYSTHIGAIDTALQELIKAIELNPTNKSYYDDLIMLAHYSPNLNLENIKEFSELYYHNYVYPWLKLIKKNINPEPKQLKSSELIKIGFLSGDVKLHPIFFWLSTLLEEADKNKFDFIIYANNSKNTWGDSLSAKNYCIKYIAETKDEDLYKTIQEDEIDILIDLSGHTALNRLEIFALKAAPLQISWLGQAGPMGIPEIDYIIADKYVIKEEEERFYTEKILRMPEILAPYPAANYSNLKINRNLAKQDGQIVLASFNHSFKINTTTIQAWAEILAKTTNTILLIKNSSATSEEYQKKLMQTFSEYNVHSNRILFEGRTNKASYLDKFSEIDIALDSFPVGGGTTTHETLMMSVPLISLFGNHFAQRSSSAVLLVSGLKELVSYSIEEYINKVIDLASRPEKIIEYKQTIREKYLSSAAADMKSFVRDFFISLEKLWKSRLEE